MSKLSTADCTKFLSTNSEVQQMVQDRYDPEDYDDDLKQEMEQIRRNGSNPKKWKRRAKYNVGSKADMGDFAEYGGWRFGEDPANAGGIVRVFWLEGSDHITLALLEKDGKLSIIEDLSD